MNAASIRGPFIVRCQRLAIWTVVLVFAAASVEGAERVNWLTGPALRGKLEQRESAGWSGQALRDALEGLSRTHRVALLVDRRIDPGQPLDVSLANTALADLVMAIAESRGLGISFFDSVIYVGPPATARRLRTIALMRKDDLSQLTSAQRLSWVSARAMHWEDFATPRDLLGQLAKEGKFEIENPDRVPHDLWAAADLPPLGMAERLSLVLAGFDLTFRLLPGGKAIKLEPMLGEVWLERSYPGGNKPNELAEKLAAALPGASVNVVDGKVMVRGLLEQHELVESGGKPPKRATLNEAALEVKTLTLTATNQSVKAILDYLRQQLGLEFKVDQAKLRKAGRSLDMLVSVSVKEASIDDTLKAVLTPAGLTFRRTEKVVEIEPGTKE